MPEDARNALHEFTADSAHVGGSKALDDLVRRLSRVVAWRYGRHDLAEDLAQETWLLMPQISRQHMSDRPLEPFLMGYMMKILQALSRKNPHPLQEDDHDGAPRSDLVDWQDGEDGACIIDVVDRQLALDAIALHPNFRGHNNIMDRAVPFVKVSPKGKKKPETRVDNPIKPRKKRTENTRELTPDQTELRNIRHKLDMTQSMFAEKIEIGLPRLVSYEHGRTATVQPEIMDRARALLGGNPEIAVWSKRFEGVSMTKIMARWAKLLGIDPDDSVTLASLIGTTPSTISRWRNDHVHPGLTELIAYEKNVEIVAGRLKKAFKAIKEDIEVVS